MKSFPLNTTGENTMLRILMMTLCCFMSLMAKGRDMELDQQLNELLHEEEYTSKIIELIQKDILDHSKDLFRTTYQKYVRENKVSFDSKIDGSLVSNLELEIELVVSEYLKSATPWAGFQGEESVVFAPPNGPSDYKWFLDPIDGTTSFSNGLDTFAFTLTLIKGNTPLATVIDFPNLNTTYIAYKKLGATKNGENIHMRNSPQKPKAILALSDDYTFDLANHPEILKHLRQIHYIPRTITDIYGYCLVAEGKCIAKFDAAGALWDLWPGCLLIEEAGGKCLFFPHENPNVDLAGSLLVGDENIVHQIHDYLEERLEKKLPKFHNYPHIKSED